MYTIIEDLINDLARFEVGWWKAHHRKNDKEAIEYMAKLYSLLFNISLADATKVVGARVKAGNLHDIAERYEDLGKEQASKEYWKKAEDALREHFRLLIEAMKKRG